MDRVKGFGSLSNLVATSILDVGCSGFSSAHMGLSPPLVACKCHLPLLCPLGGPIISVPGNPGWVPSRNGL